jgi:hypothetical protein
MRHQLTLISFVDRTQLLEAEKTTKLEAERASLYTNTALSMRLSDKKAYRHDSYQLSKGRPLCMANN